MRWFVNAALLSLVACGGEHNQHTGVDANLRDTGGTGDTLSAGCDYNEQNDATNDDLSTGGPEATSLTVGNKTTICGVFQSSHFDNSYVVDVDSYTFTVATDADVIVRLAAPGSEALELVAVDVYGGAAFDQALGSATFYGDHGVTFVHLPAGTYELLPAILNSQAITADIPYKLELAAGSLDTRCALIPSGGYTEANDGASSTGNDVVSFPMSGMPTLTTLGTDNPEPTNINITSTANNRISGSAANVTVADKFEDKDTFAFATTSANELTVRLGWSGAANLAFFVFEAGNPSPVWRTDSTTAGAETRMFSLKPSSNYWLLVGANPGAGLPAAYSATLCGSNY